MFKSQLLCPSWCKTKLFWKGGIVINPVLISGHQRPLKIVKIATFDFGVLGFGGAYLGQFLLAFHEQGVKWESEVQLTKWIFQNNPKLSSCWTARMTITDEFLFVPGVLKSGKIQEANQKYDVLCVFYFYCNNFIMTKI